MEYFIGAISLISLTINYLIYRRITATYPVGMVEELDPVTTHCCCIEVIEHLNPIEEPQEDPEPPKQNIEAYQAWTNRQDIPWVPPTKTPEPIVKAPNRGPLARPDGFI